MPPSRKRQRKSQDLITPTVLVEESRCPPSTGSEDQCMDSNAYGTSAGKNSHRECIFTGRRSGYLNRKTLGAALPVQLPLRTDQLDLSDLARIVCRVLRQRLDHDRTVRRPAQGDGVKKLTLCSESNVCVVELNL